MPILLVLSAVISCSISARVLCAVAANLNYSYISQFLQCESISGELSIIVMVVGKKVTDAQLYYIFLLSSPSVILYFLGLVHPLREWPFICFDTLALYGRHVDYP